MRICMTEIDNLIWLRQFRHRQPSSNLRFINFFLLHVRSVCWATIQNQDLPSLNVEISQIQFIKFRKKNYFLSLSLWKILERESLLLTREFRKKYLISTSHIKRNTIGILQTLDLNSKLLHEENLLSHIIKSMNQG